MSRNVSQDPLVIRGGVKPDRKRAYFTVTTDDLIKYLYASYVAYAKRINRDRGEIVIPETPKFFGGYTFGCTPTEKFFPIILSLPVEFLDDEFLPNKRKKGSEYNQMPQLFKKAVVNSALEYDGKGDKTALRLKKEIWNFFRIFKYDPEDFMKLSYFPNLSRRSREDCKYFADPRLQKNKNKGNANEPDSYIALLINPIILFKDWLKDVNHPEIPFDFDIELSNSRFINDSGIFQYSIFRKELKNKNKNGKKKSHQDLGSIAISRCLNS